MRRPIRPFKTRMADIPGLEMHNFTLHIDEIKEMLIQDLARKLQEKIDRILAKHDKGADQ